MIQEYQVIEQNYYRGLNLFLSRLFYRAPHYHRECELMMALEGEADIVFSNGKVCHLPEGQVTVVGPMVMHEIRAGENGVLLITIQTSFAMLEFFLSHRISFFPAADTDISQFLTQAERDALTNLCFSLALSYPGMPEDDAGACFLLQAKLILFLFDLLPKAEGKLLPQYIVAQYGSEQQMLQFRYKRNVENCLKKSILSVDFDRPM